MERPSVAEIFWVVACLDSGGVRLVGSYHRGLEGEGKYLVCIWDMAALAKVDVKTALGLAATVKVAER